MDKPDTALRPTQPTDPAERLQWMLGRQTDALLSLPPVIERLTEVVEQLCRRVASLDANVADLESKVARLARA